MKKTQQRGPAEHVSLQEKESANLKTGQLRLSSMKYRKKKIKKENKMNRDSEFQDNICKMRVSKER